MSCQAILLTLEIVDDWGISPAANTGWDGCIIFSHPANSGAFYSGIAFGTGCASRTLSNTRDIGDNSDACQWWKPWDCLLLLQGEALP